MNDYSGVKNGGQAIRASVYRPYLCGVRSRIFRQDQFTPRVRNYRPGFPRRVAGGMNSRPKPFALIQADVALGGEKWKIGKSDAGYGPGARVALAE